MGDESYMRLAIKEAELALEEGNWPIGCVIVLDDEVIARAHNKSYTWDKLAHAEMLALKSVINVLSSRKYEATLYTTYEPCPMCFGASMLGRIKRVVCGIDLDNSGTMYFKENLPLLFKQNFHTELTRGILARDCAEVFMKGQPTQDLLKQGLLDLKKLEELI